MLISSEKWTLWSSQGIARSIRQLNSTSTGANNSSPTPPFVFFIQGSRQGLSKIAFKTRTGLNARTVNPQINPPPLARLLNDTQAVGEQ